MFNETVFQNKVVKVSFQKVCLLKVSQMFRCTVKLRGAPSWVFIAPVSVGHKVYAFGTNWTLKQAHSRRSEERITVCIFNTVSLRWRTLPPVTATRGKHPPEVPCGRFQHTNVLIEDTVYLWGGMINIFRVNDFCNNMLHAFDVETHRWFMTRVSGTVPERRHSHSACVLGKVMYIHGGWTEMLDWTNDMYKLDTTTMVWSLINIGGTLPPASTRHSATIIGTKMFVFGGTANGCRHNNYIRMFDTEINCWQNLPSPKHLPEEDTYDSTFAYNGELYIGGVNWNYNRSKQVICKDCNTIWKFSPETFSWREVTPKVNDSFWMRAGFCCMVGSRLIIFSGYPEEDDTHNDYLHILDLSPSLKTLCKLAVIQYNLEVSGLPHDIRWELAAMTDAELED